ncbi:MAG: hypothetical protein CMK96_00410 [Pseudomonas sp.]|nr:hypothetical protein [Pseudomonas sp.]MAK85426.1 hypothetical protein [Pseudomonas sp.]
MDVTLVGEVGDGCHLPRWYDALVSPCWASSFWQSPDGRPRPKEPKSLAPASGPGCAGVPSLR